MNDCAKYPNFKIICEFREMFKNILNVEVPSESFLRELLNSRRTVPERLVDLYLQLFCKIGLYAKERKWEKVAIKFCSIYMKEDSECEKLQSNGYLSCSLGFRLKLLKTLLEAQFDSNKKFKEDVNLMSAEELRKHSFQHNYFFG